MYPKATMAKNPRTITIKAIAYNCSTSLVVGKLLNEKSKIGKSFRLKPLMTSSTL